MIALLIVVLSLWALLMTVAAVGGWVLLIAAVHANSEQRARIKELEGKLSTKPKMFRMSFLEPKTPD